MGVIRMSAYEKCEMLLKNYNNYKLGLTTDNGKIARRCVKMIDKALEALKDEPFICIITMHYIDGLTMERIADVCYISVVTAYKQRKRLIHKLKNILCSDDAIKEMLNYEKAND